MTKEIIEHQYYTTYKLLTTRLDRHKIKFEMVATLNTGEVMGHSGSMVLTIDDVKCMLREFNEMESENQQRASFIGISKPFE